MILNDKILAIHTNISGEHRRLTLEATPATLIDVIRRHFTGDYR